MSDGSSVVFSRKAPVRHEVDVFVAGGGPSGVAAAVTASRQGKRVFLAETCACFGGLGTSGLVPAFMPFTDGVNFLAGGIGNEVLERLYEMGGTELKEPPTLAQRAIGIRAEVLKRLYDQLMAEAGVQFTFHTEVLGVETEGDRIKYVICNAPSGLFAVEARMYIDATGDGDLCVWAGAPFEQGNEEGITMPGTLCSLWSNIDWNRAGDGAFQRKRLEEAFRDGVFTVQDPHLSGIFRVSDTVGGGNIGHAFEVDGTDERSLTKAYVEQRARIPEFERYYKEYSEGFEAMELVATGSILGIRETRRITGDYVLTADDFDARAVFDDEIGRFNYPVDIHPLRPAADTYASFLKEYTKQYRYAEGESYGIPLRALIPRGLSNVLVAGRCMSCDRKMQASIRVMPGCYITGQAAGMAAAVAAEKKSGTHDVPVKEVQKRLKAAGAFLPNA